MDLDEISYYVRDMMQPTCKPVNREQLRSMNKEITACGCALFKVEKNWLNWLLECWLEEEKSDAVDYNYMYQKHLEAYTEEVKIVNKRINPIYVQINPYYFAAKYQPVESK